MSQTECGNHPMCQCGCDEGAPGSNLAYQYAAGEASLPWGYTDYPQKDWVDPNVHVELVKSSAHDTDVLFAARVSTGTHVDVPEVGEMSRRDAGLINYLMRDRHGSPFEHTSMTFRITAPIVVFREFHRHRVGWSYNEQSGRYMELERHFYLPGIERDLVQSGKPGAYNFAPGNPDQYRLVWNELVHAYSVAWDSYQRMLAGGVCREVARLALPVGLYSSMYATCNARSLMHFLSLRTKNDQATVPSFPQREIEMVAEKMEAEWAKVMPVTHAAFNKNGRIAP